MTPAGHLVGHPIKPSAVFFFWCSSIVIAEVGDGFSAQLAHGKRLRELLAGCSMFLQLEALLAPDGRGERSNTLAAGHVGGVR